MAAGFEAGGLHGFADELMAAIFQLFDEVKVEGLRIVVKERRNDFRWHRGEGLFSREGGDLEAQSARIGTQAQCLAITLDRFLRSLELFQGEPARQDCTSFIRS